MKRSPWLSLLCAGALCAQPLSLAVAADRPAAGQVTGRAICEDTGRPGRFAGILLVPDHPSGGVAFDPQAFAQQGTSFAQAVGSLVGNAVRGALGGSRLATVTGPDGAFTLADVPAGTYFVVPELGGYQTPLNALTRQQRLRLGADTLAALAATARQVVVRAGQSTRVALRLVPGATLEGTITYADGTPAPGVAPTLLRRSPGGQWLPIAAFGPTAAPATDDRGVFRFYGLPAGQYAVSAVLPVTRVLMGVGPVPISVHADPGDELRIYSGGAVREADIRPIDLTGGASREVRIVFPLQGLHTVSGRVVALADGHVVNAGIVQLQDAASHEDLRAAALDAQGHFTMHYVLEGDYVLKVTVAADIRRANGATGALAALLTGCHELRAYGTTQLPLDLTKNATDLVLKVPPAAAAAGTAPTRAPADNSACFLDTANAGG